MPRANELLARYGLGGSGAGGGGFRARLRNKRGNAFVPTFPGDPDFTRREDSRGLVPAAVAEKQLEEQKKRAKRVLEQFGDQLSGSERERLLQIANHGFETKSNKFLRLLELFDRPASLLRAGVADVFEFDRKGGAEIEASDYVDLLLGRREILKERLGEAVVGKDARLSGSQLLKLIGLEEAETGLGKAARFIPTLAVEVVADPLSWISFGTLGLGRKVAGDLAAGAIKGASREAAEAVIRGRVDDVADNYVRKVAEQIDKQATEMIPELEEQFLKRLVPEGTQASLAHVDEAKSLARQAAAEAAEREVRRGELDEIVGLVTNKKFGTLAKAHPEYVRSAYAHPATTGGLTATLPFGRARLTSGVKIPGTATDRTFTKPIFDALKKAEPFIPRWMRQAFKDVRTRASAEGPVLAGRAKGRASLFEEAAEAAKERLDELGIYAVPFEVSTRLIGLHKAATDAGEDFSRLERLMSRMLEVEDINEVPVEEISENPAVVSAFVETHGFIKGKLAELLNTYRLFNPQVNEIENYFPRIATRQFADLIKDVQDLAIDPRDYPTNLRLGAEILSEYSAAVGRRARMGNRDPGAFRFSHERSIGRTVVFPLPPEIDIALIGSTDAINLLESTGFRPGFIPLDVLNEQVRGALELTLQKAGRLRRPLSADFVPFEDNVAEALNTYTAAMARSIEFLAQVEEFKVRGAVKPRDAEIDLQRTLFSIGDDVTPEMIGTTRAVVDRLYDHMEAVINAPLEQVSVELASNWTFDLPRILADDPAVVRALAITRKKVDRALVNIRKIQGEQQAKANGLIQQGLPGAAAWRIARATTKGELGLAQGAITQAANRHVKSLHEGMDAAVRSIAPDNPQAIVDVLNEMRERTTQISRAARQARKQIERQWNERFPIDEDVFRTGRKLDLSETLPNGVPITRVLADQVSEKLKERIRSLDFASLDGELQDIALRVQSDDDLAAFVQALDAQTHISEIRQQFNQWVAEHIKAEGVQLPERWRGVPIEQLPDEFVVDDDVFESFVRSVRKKLGVRANNKSEEDVEGLALALWQAVNGSFDREISRQMQDVAEGIGFAHSDALSALPKILEAMRTGDTAVLMNNVGRLSRLMEMLDFDPDGFVVDWAGRRVVWHELERRTVAPPWIDELVPELRRVLGEEDTIGMSPEDIFALSAELADQSVEFRNALSEGAQRVLSFGVDEVPFEMRAIHGVDQWLARAHVVREAVTDNLRAVRTSSAAQERVERAWGAVKAELQKAADNRKGHRALDRVWEDNRRVLRNGLPEEMYHQIGYTIDFVKARGNASIPMGALQRNRALAESTLWADPTDVVRNLEAQVAFSERALRLDQYQHLVEELNTMQQFQEQWVRSLARGLSLSEDGRVTMRENFRLFGDEAFSGEFQELRRTAMRVGKLLDNVAAEEVREADRAFMRDMARRFGLAKNWKLDIAEVNETYGYVPLSEFGLGGTALEGQIADADVAAFLENMVRNMSALYTPEGMRLLRENANAALRWWKGMATVARPTFVPRNLLGGVWNNMLISVGARDYAFVGGNITKWRHLVRGGMDPQEAITHLPKRFQPYMRGLLDSKLLDTSFSSTAGFNQIREGGAPRWLAAQTLNPLNSERFGLVRVGGRAMEASEDFLRASAFVRHFDPARPGTAETAKQLALAVHFDYTNLTELEGRIKKLIPFYVWARRNLGLQLRMVLEQPGLINRFTHVMEAADDQFTDDRYDAFPGSQYWSGMQVGTDWVLGDNTPFFARIMLDPDLPIRDLEEFMELNPVSPSSWVKFMTSLLGPQFTTPFDLLAQEDFNDVNAPAGLAATLRVLDGMGAFDDRIVVSSQGDPQIPRNARTILESTFPFLSEVSQIGTFEADPARRAASGIVSEEPDVGERLRASALRFGRFGGVQLQTPSQTSSAAFDADDTIDDILNRLRREGLIEEQK